jgi:hypothetical protein
MDEKEIVEEFDQLHKSASRSKTARLRDLYDHIEALRSRGYSQATILKAMKKHGLKFGLKTFRDTFYRIKRERANAQIRTAGSTSEAGAKLEVAATNIATPPIQTPMERSEIENSDGLSIAEADSRQRMQKYPKPQSK